MEKTIVRKPITLISKKLWFIAFRAVTAVLLIGFGSYFLKTTAFNITLIALYSAFTLIYVLYNLLSRYYSEEYIGSIIIFQLSCELIIEGLLVNQVGGNFSPFILFFIMTIMSTAPFFHLPGSIITATVASLIYSLPVFFDLSWIYDGIIEKTGFSGTGLSSDEAFYTVFLHLCLFYFFAFISGYFAEKLFFASKELSEIKFETREILEQMRTGLLTVNAGGKIVYFNRAAGEILNVQPSSAREKNIDAILNDNLWELKRYIENGLRTGRADSRSEINITHSVKGEIPLGLSSSIIRDEYKNLRGVITLFQDLTEVNELNERIRASDKMAAVGRMAAGIAHEIRNPLASISGSVEVLKDELRLEGDNQRLLELIIKESSRLNIILADFLNFARISRASSGKCDLNAVAQEVIELSGGHEKINSSVRITFHPQRPVNMISGNEDQLKQVLWNLVLNSSQSMKSGRGEIMITLEDFLDTDSREMVRLTVADNGVGIPEDTRKRIFDPFFSTKSDGTGLGLPIVSRIVDCLGGRIEVDSVVGEGTKFSIYLLKEITSEIKPEVLQEVTL